MTPEELQARGPHKFAHANLKGFPARYPRAFEYLRARKIVLSDAFYAELEQVRARSWTISKLATVEQIAQVKDSLEKATAEGLSFAQWQKTVTPEMLVLPKYYRELVFRNAVLSAHNAAKWAHFRDNAERRPILRYSAVNDSRTRPAHRALHGLMMPIDDPRWATLAPPSGHNCRCTMMSLSERQAKAFGYKGAPEQLPTYKDPHGHDHPALPDAGWAHSPEIDHLTELLRARERQAGLSRAVYNEPMRVLPISEQIHEEAKQVEPVITNIITNSVADIGILAGLNERIKSVASIDKKIERLVARMGIDIATASTMLDDVLRYTVLLELETFVQDYEVIISKLKSNGIEVATVKNSWKKGAPYKGVNIYLKKYNLIFELQCHTQESYDLKQSMHTLYEEARTTESKKRRNELLSIMRQESKKLTEPLNIGDIQ